MFAVAHGPWPVPPLLDGRIARDPWSLPTPISYPFSVSGDCVCVLYMTEVQIYLAQGPGKRPVQVSMYAI